MAQNNAVRISPDEQGNVIRVSKNNPEFAHIRVTQHKVSFNTQGWVENKSRSTLIHGKLDDLKELNLQVDQSLSGNIVIQEQTEPFNNTNPERDLKVAGETGIVCKKINYETGEEEPIYRRTFYDMTGNIQDTLVPHTNGQEIRDANGSETTNATVKPVKKKLSEKDLEKVMEKKEEEVNKTKEEEVEMEEETFEL